MNGILKIAPNENTSSVTTQQLLMNINFKLNSIQENLNLILFKIKT